MYMAAERQEACGSPHTTPGQVVRSQMCCPTALVTGSCTNSAGCIVLLASLQSAAARMSAFQRSDIVHSKTHRGESTACGRPFGQSSRACCESLGLAAVYMTCYMTSRTGAAHGLDRKRLPQRDVLVRSAVTATSRLPGATAKKRLPQRDILVRSAVTATSRLPGATATHGSAQQHQMRMLRAVE